MHEMTLVSSKETRSQGTRQGVAGRKVGIGRAVQGVQRRWGAHAEEWGGESDAEVNGGGGGKPGRMRAAIEEGE